MSKKKNKNKNKNKTAIIDPSVSYLFINKYISNFNNDKISFNELIDKVLFLFDKFPMKEILELLPMQIIEALKAYGKAYEEVEDHPCAELGTFGLEVDCYNFMRDRRFGDLYRQWLMYNHFI